MKRETTKGLLHIFQSWYSRDRRRQTLGETLKTGFRGRELTQEILGGFLLRGLLSGLIYGILRNNANFFIKKDEKLIQSADRIR